MNIYKDVSDNKLMYTFSISDRLHNSAALILFFFTVFTDQHVHSATFSISTFCFQDSFAYMGLPMVAVAKLNLLLSTSHTGASLVTFLLFPYVLKLTFTVRLFRRAYTGLLHSSRLFLFQLSQIAFDTDQPAPVGNDSTRLRRALRLIYQRVTRTRRSQTTQDDEDNFNALSMFSLQSSNGDGKR